jgi:hypothetical protein
MLVRPAGNVVLEFKELSNLRRTITLTSTEEEDEFELEQGLTAQNQITDKKKIKGEAAVKALWIDAIVNGYKMTKNELFMKGIKDVIAHYNFVPTGTEPFVNTEAPHSESTISPSVGVPLVDEQKEKEE